MNNLHIINEVVLAQIEGVVVDRIVARPAREANGQFANVDAGVGNGNGPDLTVSTANAAWLKAHGYDEDEMLFATH